MKYFDLNIDQILENWELSHAVRELIANALDESLLTSTAVPTIIKDEAGWWRIRDYGRGLRYQDLIQSENPEKLSNPCVIGKFGIGLKDALATFDRKEVKVLIRSKHGDISLSRITKHSFDDLVTLHAEVVPPSFPDLEGTECCLYGVTDAEVDAAKGMFLQYSENTLLEDTKFGSVHRLGSSGGVIYVNGMRVADEPNFLFGYNITAINASIKRALNRERQNLGRSAYSDRVRSILLACTSGAIGEALANDLQAYSSGMAHDELAWLDVQEHAVRILSASKQVLFINSTELTTRPDIVERAQASGFQIVTAPENLSKKIAGISDISGQPVTELQQFIKQRNESFQFEWVPVEKLTETERAIWDYHKVILSFLGGWPPIVKSILVSETMQSDPDAAGDTIGLWMPTEQRIVIKRTQLKSLSDFAGTLLHEAIHAKYGVGDVSRAFESHLTHLAGFLASRILTAPIAEPLDKPSTDQELKAKHAAWLANFEKQYGRVEDFPNL